MIKPKAIHHVHTLPSYPPWLLNDQSMVLCKTIESYRDEEIELDAGFVYCLLWILVKRLQKLGVLYFVEKVQGVKDGS